MKKYYMDAFESKEKFCNFINYMVSHSDKFSLVYFRYKENEPLKKSAKEIKTALSQYKIFSINGNQWPSTVTLNANNHIYNINLYKADPETEKTLTKADDIFDWDYPRFPMDLCFYKDGYAWFISSGHEGFAYVLIDDNQSYDDLIRLGANLSYVKDIDDSKLFFEEYLKVIVKSFDEVNYF